MRGINKVILIGNLGRDPEVRYLASGDAVANITVATSETWKDKNTGQQQEATEWHRIVFYGRLAEVVGEYLRKGSKVYIEGSIHTRKYQDKQTGEDRYSTEIKGRELQMLDSKQAGSENERDDGRHQGQYGERSQPRQQQPADNGQAYRNASGGSRARPAPAPQGGHGGGDDFDDIPFAQRHYLEG